jgi:voltage-gated potassium channel
VIPLSPTLAGVIGMIGIGMVALPAGLLASGFSDQLHERRLEFEQAVSRILASGTISAEEGDQLRAIRDRLGLSDHQAGRRSSGSSRTSAARQEASATDWAKVRTW